MGGCLGSPRRISYPERDSSEISGGVSIGRNQPLRRDCPKWKSDIPITEEQLRRRRDEFWDTAPVFEGHREIWDALKAAAIAVEGGDFDLAQAIIDGAGISLPNGTLSDCYDELGTRYQLPSYVLSKPTNLLLETDNKLSDKLPTTKCHAPSSSFLDKPKEQKSLTANRGSEILVKLQLSTGKELRTNVRTNDPILRLKEFVSQSENIPPSKQRMFFAGAELQNRVKVKEARIKKNYVVQVVVPTLERGDFQKSLKRQARESKHKSECDRARTSSGTTAEEGTLEPVTEVAETSIEVRLDDDDVDEDDARQCKIYRKPENFLEMEVV